jgi:hypothetical protein
MWVAGFDPGGKESFGWCLSEKLPDQPLRIHAYGCADGAKVAVSNALKKLPTGEKLAGAGVDSPLYWSIPGDRSADVIVRSGIKALDAPNPAGTVQSPNSLRGACLIQGVLAALLLRESHPGLRITESHPKALLWLMHIATPRRLEPTITQTDLTNLVNCSNALCDHERDAALGAVAAVAMLEQWPGWQNLADDEVDTHLPAGPVEYWMPLGR